MTTYNFSEISDFEFEALCRDLLQEELGLSLELFAPGLDGGIDIRYIGHKEHKEHTIVGHANAGLKTPLRGFIGIYPGRNSPRSKSWLPSVTFL